MMSTDLVETYGTDGTYAHGWAYLPRLEQLVHLTALEILKRRRDGETRGATDPSTRLFWLLFTRWLRAYCADCERQQRVVLQPASDRDVAERTRPPRQSQ